MSSVSPQTQCVNRKMLLCVTWHKVSVYWFVNRVEITLLMSQDGRKVKLKSTGVQNCGEKREER